MFRRTERKREGEGEGREGPKSDLGEAGTSKKKKETVLNFRVSRGARSKK